MRFILFFVFLLSFNVNAQVPDVVARDVLTVFKSLGVPTKQDGDFNNWVYSVSLLTARQCWAGANFDIKPKELLVGPTYNLSFVQITEKQLPLVCQSIAEKGISPFCYVSELKSDSTKKIFILSDEYLQIRRAEDIRYVKTSLFCSLNEEMLNSQIFETKSLLKWVKEPELKPVKSKNGVDFFKVGTLQIDVPLAWGRDKKPYSEKKEIVLQN